MKRFKIEQKVKIIKGYMWKKFSINADTEEEAKALIENNDAEEFCFDIDYDIELYENIGMTTEEA